MTPAPIREADLHALADGRLESLRRAEVEAWLALRPEEQARVAAWRVQNATLARAYGAVLEEPVPARLLEAARPPRRSSRWALAAAVAGLGLGAVAGFVARGVVESQPQPPAPVAALPHVAAVAHAVYAPEVRHPVEVGADQEAHLAAWLSKRLGATLRPPRLGEAGFDLVGGRLLPGDTGPVAQFMYQNARGQRLTLYVRRDAPDSGQTAFRHAQEGSVGVFWWIDGGMGYALSGELPRDELLRLANVAYHQLNQ
ncbi:MAG: anti-sigma factor [Betaproteobacteria bacterium]|nr:anti-sigma factor [Betaproteobacteria bacterium]